MDATEPSRDKKALKEPRLRWSSFTGSMEGIPERCVCGKGIVRERAATEVYDYLPGKRFFTCEEYKNDGLHYRQPWVCAIEEQLGILKGSVGRCEEYATRVLKLELQNEELQAQIHGLQNSVTDTQGLITRILDLEVENQEIKEEVEELIERVSLLEYST